MSRPWILYGANGYTGRLVAREAVRRGLSPVLAGRDAAAVGALADELGLEARAFPLTDPGSLRAHLAGAAAVLHCAGPFAATSRPMMTACIDTGTSYLDITGEIEVFEQVLARAEAARRAEVAMVPGVGFDVVPTDCLAARLAAALPGATHLQLAFVNLGGGTSRGTARTALRHLPAAGAERRDGRIVPLPAAHEAIEIEVPLPGGETAPRWVVSIPWGDVATAWHSTGIPNIRTYVGMHPRTIRRLRRWRFLLPLTALGPVRRALEAALERRFAAAAGPDAETRRRARVAVWGRVRDGAGGSATATLLTPEGYELTARSSVECVRRVLAGEVPHGAWTPSQAFGADLVAGLEGVEVGPVRTAG